MSTKSRKDGTDGLPLILYCSIALVLTIIQPLICPSFPLMPQIAFLIGFTLKLQGRTYFDNFVFAITKITYDAVILAYPISFIFPLIPYRFYALFFSCAMFPIVINRTPFHYIFGYQSPEVFTARTWYRIYIQLFWNPPLMFASLIIAKVFGGVLFSPLISIIDDDICIGSLPITNANVLALYSDPYHIRGIVNCCMESEGPIVEYDKYHMKHFRIMCMDCVPPSLEMCILGVQWMKHFIQERNKHPNRKHERIFIHCKAGTGRSVCVGICWLISKGCSPKDAFAKICKMRPTVFSVVLEYECIRKFAASWSNKREL